MEPKINVLQVMDFARSAHAGQMYGNQDFIWHVFRVALNFNDPVYQACALLHDTVEDTPVTLDEVRETFGEEIAEIVDILTRKEENEDYMSDYIPKVAGNRIARRIKLGDVNDHLSNAYNYPEYRDQMARYRKAQVYLVKAERADHGEEEQAQKVTEDAI